MTELRETIRSAALGLGLDQVGFAPVDRPLHATEFEAWLAAGHHGEMGYMSRLDTIRRRLDPTEALPGCKTAIVTSLVYGPGSKTERAVVVGGHRASATERRRLPIVARYAVGRDYHDVFEERLDALAAVIAELAPSAQTKRYVDYGPVLERDFAQLAGLGWIGKNTMLIDPELGSYLMLGELLTDLDLPPDDPFVPDRCGTCRRCIDACPTDAILDGRIVDARLCISYLTIELRGPIPEDLRPAIGNRVFGCDICQEVCPWNDGAPSPERSPFEVLPGQAVAPEDMSAWAEELLALTDDAFKKRYRGTAFARPGREGMLRNLAVGLGNAADEADRPLLERMAAADSPLVREHALWSLERLTQDHQRDARS